MSSELLHLDMSRLCLMFQRSCFTIQHIVPASKSYQLIIHNQQFTYNKYKGLNSVYLYSTQDRNTSVHTSYKPYIYAYIIKYILKTMISNFKRFRNTYRSTSLFNFVFRYHTRCICYRPLPNWLIQVLFTHFSTR